MSEKTMTDGEIRARNRRTLDIFMGIGGEPWWSPGSAARSVLADDFVMEAPFAPRGMAKRITMQDVDGAFEFLLKSIGRTNYHKGYVYETDDPYTFVTEDEGRTQVTWGGGGIYHNRHISVFRCDEQGRLRLFREYFNPQYHWPENIVDAGDADTFDENAERARVGLDPVPLTWEQTHVMPELGAWTVVDKWSPADDEKRARCRETVDAFIAGPAEGDDAWWVPGSPGSRLLANGFMFEAAFAPRGMQKRLSGEGMREAWDFAHKTCLGEYKYLKKYFWETSDPRTFITEDEGEVPVTWAGGGLYCNRHITVYRCDDEAKLLLMSEYFNPIYHFPLALVEAGNGDTFDVNEERVRVGLDPLPPLPREVTHHMPRLE